MSPKSYLPSEETIEDNLRSLRTTRSHPVLPPTINGIVGQTGNIRVGVRCKRCKTRLEFRAVAIRQHLQSCPLIRQYLIESVRSQEQQQQQRREAIAENVSTTAQDNSAATCINNVEQVSDKAESSSSSISNMNGQLGSMEIQGPRDLLKPLQLPQRVLTGPGPSNCSPRVLRALQNQVLGHMHPEVFQLMDEVKAGLQYLFQTQNKLTLAISASGHSGIEASIGNLLERGEKILIVKSGIWGERAADISERLGLEVEILQTKLGEPLILEELESSMERFRPQAVFIVHSESSTGFKQPLEGVSQIVHKHDGLLIVDTVASLGAEKFSVDALGIDACYTGSQKVLSAPAGLTPITFSPLAVSKIMSRKTKSSVFYWDMKLLGSYWNCFDEKQARMYHHTISATLLYGLREALSQLVEQGLQASWEKHETISNKFRDGLIQRGFKLFVKRPECRLNTVTAIVLPENVDPKMLSRYAMERYNVEIAGGLGPTVGKIIRIGFMGENATTQHITLVLRVLEEAVNYAKIPMSHV